MGELSFCNYSDIRPFVLAILETDISGDRGVPFLLIRMLHNKILYTVLFSIKCYLNYFDFAQILSFVSAFLVPFILFAIIERRWRKQIIIFTLIIPVIFIFLFKNLEIGWKIYIFQEVYILLAFTGAIKVIKKVIFKNS